MAIKTCRLKQSSQKTKQKTAKKISVKETIEKVVDTVKKPFSTQKDSQQTKGKSRKKEKIYIDVDEDQQINKPIQNSSNQSKQKFSPDVPFAESSSRASHSQFFYANDVAIDNFDDQQLYVHLAGKYPGLLASEESELAKRNAIIEMLNDTLTMQKILEDYNMTILDFFKFLFRLCPSVFKGLFVKKIQKTIQDKPYAKSLRFGNYSFSRNKKQTRRCSIF